MSYLGPVSSNQDGTIINYIPYGTIENNTTRGWSACTLTWSGTTPSGAPTLTATQMAISASSTDPLSSLYSLLLTKSAANAQYQGFVSDAFTIKREDLAKVLTGSFYYEVASGTVDMSGSSTQSLEIWVYNVNANQWIQPAGYRGLNQSSGPGLVSFTFQTDSTAANNSYRIAVITQQTSATAYTVKFDNFKLSPQTAPIGPVVTDWVSYTPTGTWVSGATYTGKYRRVGDSIQCSVKIAITGPVTATDLQVSIPSGFSIDTAKMASGDFLQSVFGTAHAYDVSTLAHYNFQIGYASPTLLFFTVQNQLTGQVISVTNTAPQTWANGDSIHATFMVPVVGASSNVQLSNDTDTRVVSFVGSINAQGYTSLTTNLAMTVSKDSHGAFSSGVYTIPVSGDYSVNATVISDQANFFPTVYLNGGIYTYGTRQASASQATTAAMLIPNLKAGDTISLRIGNTNGNTIAGGYFSINRLSGPSVVAASETVAAMYTNASGQSIPSGGYTPITGWTRNYDTHSILNSGTGVVTIPVSGKYTFSMFVTYTSASVPFVGCSFYVELEQAGSVARSIPFGLVVTQEINTYVVRVLGHTTINCNAGDTVRLRTFQNTGGARTLVNSDYLNVVSITRVGN